ncbi:MAG: hypothetical protein ACR2KZ_18165, partial [Segetibacter sp.]
QVALSNFLIILFALPIAAIWLHEKLSMRSIIGGLLVLIGTLSITVWEYKQSSAVELVTNNKKVNSTVKNL